MKYACESSVNAINPGAKSPLDFISWIRSLQTSFLGTEIRRLLSELQNVISAERSDLTRIVLLGD